jgi:hypothetical protein
MTTRENTPFESFIFERCKVFIDAKEDRQNGMTRAQWSYMSQAWAMEWWLHTSGEHTDNYLDVVPSVGGAVKRYHDNNGLKSPLT